uniref:ATP-dependent Clp protease proteolytic subunit n=1 Tax=Heterorhabditis bacteriophora TaxID=37862 RepID=A0A1I7WL55_HETBA
MRWKAGRKGEETTNEPLFAEDEDEQVSYLYLDILKKCNIPTLLFYTNRT